MLTPTVAEAALRLEAWMSAACAYFRFDPTCGTSQEAASTLHGVRLVLASLTLTSAQLRKLAALVDREIEAADSQIACFSHYYERGGAAPGPLVSSRFLLASKDGESSGYAKFLAIVGTRSPGKARPAC